MKCRANPQLDVHLPITRPVLHHLFRSLEFTNSSSYQRVLYTAMFLTAFYGFFRLGELASKNKHAANPTVQFDQLTFLLQDDRPAIPKICISQYKHSLLKRLFDVLINRCYRRIMIAIQSAGSSNIVQHLFSAYNYEFD